MIPKDVTPKEGSDCVSCGGKLVLVESVSGEKSNGGIGQKSYKCSNCGKCFTFQFRGV